MNEISNFVNDDFGKIRSVQVDGEPWFVVSDICEIFSVTNRNRVMQEIPEDEKGGTQMNTPGGVQTVTVVNESGLYSLLFALQPKKARNVSEEYVEMRTKQLQAFKRWVTHEVLPTIRKTGGYVNNSEVFIDNYLPFADDTTKQLFRLTLDVVDKQNKEIAANRKEIAEKSAIIEEMTPKASYYDLVINSPSLVPITAIAKDFGISAIALNRLLHTEGIQFLNNNMWVLYQKYADKGYVGTKTYAYPNKAGKMVNTRMQTFWTQKGRLFIYNLLKGKGILPIMERGVA
jgi:prophage antirepressor-like protein